MSTIAIMLRAHGGIPTNINPQVQITANDLFNGQTVSLVDYRQLGIPKLSVVTSARLAGVCYGAPNVKPYIDNVNGQYYTYASPNYDTAAKVYEMFGPNPPAMLSEWNRQLFGNSFAPEIAEMRTGLTFNKTYTGHDANSGVFLFSQNGKDENAVKQTLAGITAALQSRPLTRHEILAAIAPFQYDHVFLIDLSCNVYQQLPNTPTLTEDYVNWINEVFHGNGVRGGTRRKKTKRRNKKRRKRTRR